MKHMVNGEELSVYDAAMKYGLSVSGIRMRIKRLSITVEQAVNMPRQSPNQGAAFVVHKVYGEEITVKGIAEKYGIPRGSISRWKSLGYSDMHYFVVEWLKYGKMVKSPYTSPLDMMIRRLPKSAIAFLGGELGAASLTPIDTMAHGKGSARVNSMCLNYYDFNN